MSTKQQLRDCITILNKVHKSLKGKQYSGSTWAKEQFYVCIEIDNVVIDMTKSKRFTRRKQVHAAAQRLFDFINVQIEKQHGLGSWIKTKTGVYPDLWEVNDTRILWVREMIRAYQEKLDTMRRVRRIPR